MNEFSSGKESLATFVVNGFGGYEKAKAVLDNPNSASLHNTEALKQRLLEYRRENNIIEVGDLIVLPYTNYRIDVFELTKLLKETYDDKGFAYRHATTEEIKAGHRL